MSDENEKRTPEEQAEAPEESPAPEQPEAPAEEPSTEADEPQTPAEEPRAEAEEPQAEAGESATDEIDELEFELRELKEVAKQQEEEAQPAEASRPEPEHNVEVEKTVEDELEELKERAGDEEGPRPDAATTDEIRQAMDEEDGIPAGDEATDDEAPEEREGAEPPKSTEDELERTRMLTGFGRAHLPLMLLLPPLTYYMWICLTFYGGRLVVPASWGDLIELVSHVPAPTWQALLIFLGWMGLQVLLQAFAPGKQVQGTPQPNGERLTYTMNGLLSFGVTLALSVILVATGLLPATLLAEQFGPLLTIGHIFAFGFSGFLYVHGLRDPAGAHITGRPLYDYFMGTARNPRIGDFDLKLFFEARPGLMLWTLINLSFAAQQYELHGTVTTPMILVCLFHLAYVTDYFIHERAILTTMDIKHENFGWMLCWGDFPWVPFTYTIQAMYLVNHTHELSPWATAGIVALNVGGFFLFRSVNNQKNRFREDPSAPIWGAEPEYIETKRGTLLLTSGYWGKARHLNYLGDLMMGLSWCLPCGFGHVLPYFYIIYFTVLLLHRQWRDDKMCQAKYGEDWDAYVEKVPWRIIPYVY